MCRSSKKKRFFAFEISRRLLGVGQKTWYLGISTARVLHAEHVFEIKKYVYVPHSTQGSEKLFSDLTEGPHSSQIGAK